MMEIWQFDLCRGKSDDPRHGACLLDAYSWFKYGRLGDHPPCVAPVFAAYGRGLNDLLLDDRRQELKRFIPRLAGTVDPDSEVARAEYLAWQAVRAFAPPALEVVGLNKHADILRGQTNLVAAAEAADAAADAAWVAARAAAGTVGDAAWAAAEAAAEARHWAARGTVRAAAAAVRAAAGAAHWAAAVTIYWAATAAEAAAEAAAEVAARAAAEAAIVVSGDGRIYDCAIAALDGVLRIGRQAPEVEPEIIERANRTFAAARGELVA